MIYYKAVSLVRLACCIFCLRTLDSVLQEEHLQLPGWQVQEVHLQEAESQAMVLVLGWWFGVELRFSMVVKFGLDGLYQKYREEQEDFIPLCRIAEPSISFLWRVYCMSPTETRAVAMFGYILDPSLQACGSVLSSQQP
jgi:hypothetical protein